MNFSRMPGLYLPSAAVRGALKMLPASIDFVRLLIDRFTATRCPQVAGSLTYTTLLALVPLVTVSLSLFSNFPSFAELGEALSGFLQNNILPDRAGQIVATYALEFSEKAAQLTLIGTAMLVVTVLLLLHTIDSVFNDIWGVRTPRPLLTRLTVYWVVLTVGPFALAGSVFATGRLVATSIEFIGNDTQISAFSTTFVPLGLIGTLFSFLYFAVPNHPVRLVHAAIGGFAAAVAFLVMQRMFGSFIAGFPTYTLIYGTFAAMPIFLVWLYFSWVVVLAGALLTATLPGFFERKRIVESFPGDKAWAALSMLAVLARAQHGGAPVPFDALRSGTGLSQDFAETVLGEMRERGWVARTDEHCWVLCKSPDLLSVSEVVRLFALDPGRWIDTAAGGPCVRSAAERLSESLQSADLTLSELAHSPFEKLADA